MKTISGKQIKSTERGVILENVPLWCRSTSNYEVSTRTSGIILSLGSSLLGHGLSCVHCGKYKRCKDKADLGRELHDSDAKRNAWCWGHLNQRDLVVWLGARWA